MRIILISLICLMQFALTASAQVPKQDSIRIHERTIKKINLRLNAIKGGFIVGGAMIVIGSIVNIKAENLQLPDSTQYNDIAKYLEAVRTFERKRTVMKEQSSYFIAGGGLVMMISGISLTTIKIADNSRSKLTLKTGMNKIAFCYRF